MRNWTLFEAVAVSIGFEPCGDTLEDNLGKSCQSQVVDFYHKRLRLFEDNFTWSRADQTDKRPAKQVYEWMRDVDLDIPPELQEYASVSIKSPNGRGNSNSITRNTIDPRERKTMLRLIIGLAIGGYSFDPDALRSKIPKEIADGLDLLGIHLDRDTIRNYRREASELLKNDLQKNPDG